MTKIYNFKKYFDLVFEFITGHISYRALKTGYGIGLLYKVLELLDERSRFRLRRYLHT